MTNQENQAPRNLTFSERMTAALMATVPENLNQTILRRYEEIGQPINPAIIAEADRMKEEAMRAEAQRAKQSEKNGEQSKEHNAGEAISPVENG